MNLFDRLVEQAMQSERALGIVRPALEKELLHHDILREMNQSGLMAGLTFIGGTCLRACHGSPRLSEDLDFTGGSDFKATQLSELGSLLENTLMEKYGLHVEVSAPVREEGNISTWKLRMQTRAASKHLPAQRIHIDICALPSHRPLPSLLRNAYGVNMGTEGLIVQAQSREEILADKWVALAFRPNRIKYRDLWDILWLSRQNVRLETSLIFQKMDDRNTEHREVAATLVERIRELETDPRHQSMFRQEMGRFVFAADQREAVGNPGFWDLLIRQIREQSDVLFPQEFS
ncbi:MAG: nucleotidyl transferase AbiEii/AbiGii toxin family protein [Verrucomicrobia bacterium]|nr:nucleotidyl transferase AbiEii/AbiGii toxin family protein [Verrucomicrobiota bacterium]